MEVLVEFLDSILVERHDGPSIWGDQCVVFSAVDGLDYVCSACRMDVKVWVDGLP